MISSKAIGYLRDFSLVAFSSLLLVLSFPDFNQGYLVWVGLIPLFLVLRSKCCTYSFVLSLMCGIVFFCGLFRWILTVQNYTLLHHALLALYLGSYFGLFGVLYTFLTRRLGLEVALFASPFIWVSLEYLRSNFLFLSLPWGLLAHSQYRYPHVIQIASFSGAYGVSFLIVMANAALAMMVITVKQEWIDARRVFSGRAPRTRSLMLGGACAALTFSLLYGVAAIQPVGPGRAVEVAAVQGNIEQSRKWDGQYAKDIMRTYAQLTREASKSGPALIVWPETATPRSIGADMVLFGEVLSIARDSGAYLLLGSSQRQKFQSAGKSEHKYLNSAFLIRPDTRLERPQRYDKMRLLPFGEYLPWKGTIPWKSIGVPEVSEYIPGEVPVIFEMPGARFGVTICWENIFPDIVRASVRSGAQFIVNITNEAWFGKTAAPYQFLSMSVFRAVENRVYVVRAANTGVSCVIDPYGRIGEKVIDSGGRDIFVAGVINGWITPALSATSYSRYGDVAVWIALIGSLAILIAALFRESDKLSQEAK